MRVLSRPSKISSAIAVLCIFIYIVAIAFGIVQIIENIGERRIVAEKEFYDLADRASSSAVFLGFMSRAYEETIKDFISGSETLLGAIITGSDGEYAFERHQGSGIIWNGSSPRFKTGAGFFGEPFLLYLRIEGQRNVTIQAIYSPVESSLTIKVLRNTLIAVLAALAIALVTLLLELTSKNKTGNYHSREAEKAFKSDENDEPLPAPEISVYEPIHSDYDAMAPVEEAETGEETAPEDDVSSETPQGLFTPRGNIGWESYTHERLDSELHRCASFEQDLVFMVMEFGVNEKLSDGMYRQFADEAVSFFAMRDLIFEREENGLAIIIPNEDLEHGIVKAEGFRSQIIAKLAESPESMNTITGTELCIGLSSRSGRLIEADRLILEASKALEKALGDPASPIMAFKSDLEKYREFIKERS